MNAHSQATTAEPQDIELSTLWSSVLRSLRNLLILTSLAGIATFVVLSLMAPRYTAESQLVLAAKRSNPFPEGSERFGGSSNVAPRLDREAVNTHARALLAPTLLFTSG